jgi:hypothetical protein
MKIVFAAVAGFISAAVIGLAAAQMPPSRDMVHPPIDIATVLNVDADKAIQVEAILRATHEKMRAAMEEIGPPKDDATRAELREIMEAIRVQSDQLLAVILTPDQIAVLHAALHRQRGARANPAVWKKG